MDNEKILSNGLSNQPDRSIATSPNAYDKLQLNPINANTSTDRSPLRHNEIEPSLDTSSTGVNNLGYQGEKSKHSSEPALFTPYAINQPVRYINNPASEARPTERSTPNTKVNEQPKPSSPGYLSIEDLTSYTTPKDTSPAQYEELPADNTKQQKNTRKRNLIYEPAPPTPPQTENKTNVDKEIKKTSRCPFCKLIVLFIMSVVAIVALIIALLLISGAISVSCSNCDKAIGSIGTPVWEVEVEAEVKRQLAYLKENLTALNGGSKIAALEKESLAQKALIQRLREDLEKQEKRANALNNSINNMGVSPSTTPKISSKCNFTEEGAFGSQRSIKVFAHPHQGTHVAYATCGFENASGVSLHSYQQYSYLPMSYYCECGGGGSDMKGCFIYYWMCPGEPT